MDLRSRLPTALTATPLDMPARLVLVLLAIATIGFFSCSKGIGNNRRNGQAPPVVAASSNLPVGVDPGPVLTAPAGEPAVAGVVVPGIGTGEPREVVLLAFTSAAASNDGDGGGTPLSRDATADGNGATDVFVAAISAQDVETRAFSQSLAGKFRHPRCVTCHSMQAATTTAFVSAASIGFPHQGPLPGPLFPNNDPATCAPCHVAGTAFPVPTWQAPAVSFDMRTDTVAQLVTRANNIPAGDIEHFVTDARVLWALDSGILPTIGNNNGVADDDQDGIDEPEDRDGTPRPVPGGSVVFLQEIEDWIASGKVPTAAAAVKDVTLASRAFGTTNAGNGASARPRVLWVPNPGFNPANAVTAAASNPIGTLFVAFQSEASDLVAGDGNGASDVFRAAVELRAEEDATGAPAANGLNLVFVNSSTLLCSAVNATLNPGNAASTHAEIGGDNAQFVAFQSLATNLIGGFVDGNGAGADVYVRLLDTATTLLVSHQSGNAATGGSGASEAPALDATGTAIAFESDASDLIVGDTNGVRDVFHARIDTGSPFAKVRNSVTDTGAEGTGGASRAASVHFGNANRVLVAFESDKTNLAPVLGAPTNVFLFDSATGFTTLLNQRVSPSGDAIGDGPARAPRIAPNGLTVAFESEAANIDVLRAGDLNRAADIFLVEVPQVEAGNVLPFRVSITATSGADSNGASTAVAFGNFADESTFPVGFVAYPTLATNLGTSDSTKLMVSFLSETSGVFASFSATPLRGAAPLSVQFTDESSGLPTGWEWDFDNNGTVDSTAQNPNFVFEAPGLYTVRLVARNANSNGTKIETDLVLAVGPVVPDFTASTTAGPAALSVTFTDTSTQSPLSWEWDFENDGIVDSTLQNPTHIYTAPGTYSVRLVATNEAGPVTTIKNAFITAFTPVVANFSGTPLAGVAPFAVTFTNLTTGDATNWDWDFDGDAITDSTAQNPAPFTYTSSGNYTVSLTASGPGGTDTETKVAYVAAAGAVTAQFTANATSQYNNVAVQFTDQSTGTISTWAWDFQNDGIPDSSAQNPSFTFTTPGTYSVRLTVSGPGGIDSELKVNYITSVPNSVSDTIEALKDTSIYSESPTFGNGGDPEVVCGNAATLLSVQQGIRRCVVEFNVAGNIPAGSTILTASLQMTCTYNPMNPTGAQSVSLRRVLTEWTEGTNNSGIGGGGAATGNGATWALATSGASPVDWTDGGSFSGTVSASTTVNTAGAYNWLTNATMVSNVQLWLDSATDNHGWILRAGETSGTRTAKVFGSRTNATFASRPKLNITYQPPL